MSGEIREFRPTNRTSARRDRIAALEARVAELEVKLGLETALADRVREAVDPEFVSGYAYRAGEQLYMIWYAFEAGDERVPLHKPWDELPEERKRVFQAMTARAVLYWAAVYLRDVLNA